MSGDGIEAVLAQHTPACSGPRGPFSLPVHGVCGPIYCVECSREDQEWVTWTPAHVAAALREAGYVHRDFETDALAEIDHLTGDAS